MFHGTKRLVQYHSVDKQLSVALAYYASSTCQWGVFSCSSYGATDVLFPQHQISAKYNKCVICWLSSAISNVFRIKFDKIIQKTIALKQNQFCAGDYCLLLNYCSTVLTSYVRLNRLFLLVRINIAVLRLS
jgi:hypothetical protein